MSNGPNRTSFIEEARRRQIVDTAIRTIASRGYARSSLAEIAREAGISKGVISYHFEGKPQLVEAILARLLEEPAEFIKPRVDAAESALDKLRTYVGSNFEFMKTHRANYVALVDLWESRAFSAEAYAPSRAYLSRILESGHSAGELRARPAATLASVIQAAIDGVMLQWVFDERTIDLDACRDEILAMISRHVVPTSAPSTTGAQP